MARASERFVCQECAAATTKWAGRCASCGAWNAMVEEANQVAPPKSLGAGKGRLLGFSDLAGSEPEAEIRATSGIGEFDRVTGGGLVPGSAVLVGGDPGIGKSTVLLQVAAGLARKGISAAYISGEEAVGQIRMRARRLGLDDAPVQLAAATNLRDIVTSIDHDDAPRVVVIDSIQTVFADILDSAPGTVSQVRTCAQELIRIAKKRDIVVLLVGHVTKDGQIAGPRVLEHMVDTVLYFEGERGHHFRILRAVKNRFGASDEIGVFEMTDRGLMEVANPSELFLSNRERPVSGAAVFAGIEGSRPLLMEVQALATPSPLGTPRRTVVGWDSNRLAMLIAVLEARCGIAIAGQDIFLNVAGGLRISEPAADLAVAAALLSSLADQPLPSNTVYFGEVSLSGEVRPVSQADMRLKEARKLGFTGAVLPKAKKPRNGSATLHEITLLQELAETFTSGRQPKANRGLG